MNHVAKYFFETVICCPVEYAQIKSLLLCKILLSDLFAMNSLLFTFLSCFTFFLPLDHWSHLYTLLTRYKWLDLRVFGLVFAYAANINELIRVTVFYFFFILLYNFFSEPNSESFDGLTVAHKAGHINRCDFVDVEHQLCASVQQQLHQ